MKKIIFTLAIILLMGCEDNSILYDRTANDRTRRLPPINNRQLTIKTNKVTYRPNEQINFLISNGTDSSVYFWHCKYLIGFYIEKNNEDRIWNEYTSAWMECVAIYPSGIKTIQPNHCYEGFTSLQNIGTYRLRIPFGCLPSDAWSYYLFSNVFNVK